MKKVEYHHGPLDGKRFDPTESLIPEDIEYKVRVDESGIILGAWWSPEPLERI